MISKEEFIHKIKTEVFPKLLATEKARKKALLKGYFFIFLACLFVPLLFKNFNDIDSAKIFLMFVYGFILVGGIIWADFRNQKKAIFSPIFLNFLGDLTNKRSLISDAILRYTALFPTFDYVSYDDSISGTFENTQFSVSEICLKRRDKRFDLTVFNGICINIPMKSSVSGYTLLFNTKIPQMIPVLKKVKLEDVSFSKKYQIYSDNQIDARVLLTPAFMERLDNLQKCFHNKRVDVSFFDNQAVFVIHTSKNLFEAYPLFRSVTDVKTYERFYDEVKAIYDMINLLSINNMTVPVNRSNYKKLYRQMFPKNKIRLDAFIDEVFKVLKLFAILFFICFIIYLLKGLSSFFSG